MNKMNTEPGEVQKSSVLSDHLNYTMLKGYYVFLPDETKNELPTSALIYSELCCEGSKKEGEAKKHQAVVSPHFTEHLQYNM